MRRSLFFIILLFSMIKPLIATAATPHADIGFIVPMTSESVYICKTYFGDCQAPTDSYQGVKFFSSNQLIKNKKVVFANSGVGLENITLTTTAMINHYHPKIIIMLGSAGGINAKTLGDVIFGKDVFDAEFGSFTRKDHRPYYPQANISDLQNPNKQQRDPLELGYTRHQHITNAVKQSIQHFAKHPLKAHAGESQPQVRAGVIADSTVFYTPNSMTNQLKKDGVDAVAFEDIGFLHTCWFYNSPCLAIRGVSNPLPASKENPADAATYAGKNATIVAIQFLQDYFQSRKSQS